MNRFISLALAATIATASLGFLEYGGFGYSLAQEPAQTQTQPAAETEVDMCRGFYDLAHVVMEQRQDGYPMPELMNDMPNEMTRNVVITAYDRPRYGTEEYKARAADDFANEAYLVCVQSLN